MVGDDDAAATTTRRRKRRIRVPKREFLLPPGGNNNNNNNNKSVLPATVPIVGLGCSSFSTFFFTKEELAGSSSNSNSSNNDDNDDEDPTIRIHDGDETETENAVIEASPPSASPSAVSSITAEKLTRDHPKAKEWIETIRYAIEDCGISLLDTAPWYGHGTSEIVVGWALREILLLPEAAPDTASATTTTATATTTDIDDEGSTKTQIARKDLCINTKVGRYEADPSHQFDFSREATIASAKRSLNRLFPGFGHSNDNDDDDDVVYIDVLQLHDPEFSPTLRLLLEETIPAMVECRSRGWCRALGLTGYPLEVQYQILTDSLERYGTEPSKKIWDQALTYGHFNLHDSSLVDRRVNATSGSFAAFCHHQGMGLLAAAPLSMGLLTNNPLPDWHPANNNDNDNDNDNNNNDNNNNNNTETLKGACSEAASICKGLGVDIADLALLFAMSHPSLPCTILGMKDTDQVERAATIAVRFAGVDWGIVAAAAAREEEEPPQQQQQQQHLTITQDTILRFVLTVPERRAYEILRDPVDGPFANVWKRRDTGTDYDGDTTTEAAAEAAHYAPRFQWDGIREAHDFWKAASAASGDGGGNGTPFEDWQKKKFR